MSTVRFRAGDVDLELSGSEPFIDRQLSLLSCFLGTVDEAALTGVAGNREPAPVVAPAAEERAEPVAEQAAESTAQQGAAAAAGLPSAPEADGASRFYSSARIGGRDTQTDAALLFAYWLQEKEGRRSLEMRDLIRCCIQAGVDTRNFNRAVGSLARDGLLETLRQGQAYRLSEQGIHAVESRL